MLAVLLPILFVPWTPSVFILSSKLFRNIDLRRSCATAKYAERYNFADPIGPKSYAVTVVESLRFPGAYTVRRKP